LPVPSFAFGLADAVIDDRFGEPTHPRYPIRKNAWFWQISLYVTPGASIRITRKLLPNRQKSNQAKIKDHRIR